MNAFNKRALTIICLGAITTLCGLYWLPQPQAAWLRYINWPAYSSITANTTATISGIVGPIIALATLLVVYFTLREQATTNRNTQDQINSQNRQLDLQEQQLREQQRQFRETTRIQANNNFLDLTFKVIERFSEAVERQKKLFIEAPALDFERSSGRQVSSGRAEGAWVPAWAEELTNFNRQLHVLTQFFSVVQKRFAGNELTGEQKLLLIDLVDASYGEKLRTAIITYQGNYGMDRLQRNMPDIYRLLDEQDIAIAQLRQAAEAQAATESIPFEDDEQ